MTEDELVAAAECAVNDARAKLDQGYGLTQTEYDAHELGKAWLAEHPADDGEAVTVEWLRCFGAAIRTDTDGYVLCEIHTPATTQRFDADGEAGPVVLEFLFREDGAMYDAVIATYSGGQSDGPDVNIPRPRTRGRVRHLCAALGVTLKETP